MSTREDEPLLVYQRGRDLLEQQLQQSPVRVRWAALFARTLRALWPDAVLCYCRLDDGPDACALEDGKENDIQAAALEEPITRWLATPDKDAPETLPAPESFNLSTPLLLGRIQAAGASLGAAAVAFRASSAVEPFWAAEVLGELCTHLGLRLLLNEQRRREVALLQEHEQQTGLCGLADMIGPVSHEMQNIFNNLVLQIALVSRDVPQEVRPEIDVMRRLSLEASAMMGKLDSYRYGLSVVRRPVDLNRTVASLLAGLPVRTVPVRQELSSSLPPVVANENDLRRLLGLLVANARAVVETQGGGTVTVRTVAKAGKVGKVCLIVEDDGPGLGDEDPGKVFEPFVQARPGENSLELAACQGLVRKLGGVISAAGDGAKGLTVTVELEAAVPAASRDG